MVGGKFLRNVSDRIKAQFLEIPSKEAVTIRLGIFAIDFDTESVMKQVL